MITTFVVQNNINCNENDGGNVVMLVSINHIYDDDDIGGGKTTLIMERNTAQCVKGGGVRKMFFFRENQRFVLVIWAKLLNVQP